jgi:hypothetical protein
MSKQVHFVVVADLNSETWWVDDETFGSRSIEQAGTWNTTTEEWEKTSWEDNLAGLKILNKGRES